MPLQFIILCIQTIFFWSLVVFLHRKRSTFTLIPIYVYIGVLTIITHNISDLGFAVTMNNWFFLISSFTFFTTLMFATLYLYLFEGPRAGRLALWTIIGSSLLYIATVFLIGIETDATNWVRIDTTRLIYYFWSILAVIIDVIVMAIIWELLSRLKNINIATRVFVTVFCVFALDTLIFVSGVFGGSEMYLTILRGDLITRFVLCLIGAPIMAYFLHVDGFTETKRIKPRYFWEILNFRSDLETKIENMQVSIEEHLALEKKLSETEETYRLAIASSGAGLWDWDMVTNKIIWSEKACSLLGYNNNELPGTLDGFKKNIHPEDIKKTFDLIEQCLKDGKPFEIEYRLKTKSGKYKWYLTSGTTKFDLNGKPTRMVGSIIDIHIRKDAELTIANKIEELTKVNNIMVSRELAMIELKKQISDLKQTK